jgi:crotonobetainyl-CoA:carnitine CoA-transferase CaiB-like acyl-CoA transferase
MSEALAADTFPGAAAPQEGALASIRVLEVGSLIAGPFAGRLMADAGADVIKVEPPGKPDPLRSWGTGTYKGRKLFWPVQARGKRCITLDLRQERGQELFLELVEQCDVVIENLRPGSLEGWNLGYERLSAVNPGLILARISGYGQTGPLARRAGFASVAEAVSGLRQMSGFPDRPPPRLGISLGDSLASLFALQGILLALTWRATTGAGRGQVVDVALTEACFAMLESAVPEYDRLGVSRGPTGTSLAGIVPSNVFRSADERWVVIAANVDNVFRRLTAAIGRPELADDPRFATHDARADNKDAIEAVIADWAAARDAQEIDRVLSESGVPAGVVATMADVFEDPQFQARDMLVDVEDETLGTYKAPGIVPKLSETPGSIRWSGRSEPGADNVAVYGGLLDRTDEELDDLRREGLI